MTTIITPTWRYAVAKALESAKGWRRQAVCGSEDPELFFAKSGQMGREAAARYAKATQVCAVCPVKRECLVDALLTEQTRRYGVFGGTRPTERGGDSVHPLVVEARAAIAEWIGDRWIPQANGVDHAAVLRRSEGEPVPLTNRDTRAAVVRCVKGGRTFTEAAEDLGLNVAMVSQAWSRAQAAARLNGDPVPWKPDWDPSTEDDCARIH